MGERDIKRRMREYRQMSQIEICENVQMMLGLVAIEVPVDVLKDRSHRELAEAEYWAAKTHLWASDNPVCVPYAPAWLLEYGDCSAS